MVKTVKKEKPEKGDVLENAEERIDYAMENYNTILVGFSGGKDSGTVMNLALEGHERAGRDDFIHALHIDDEVIPPETEKYVKEVAQYDRVKMWWVCLPVKYYNGCSTEHQEWYTWNPEHQDKWVRDMPTEFCKETENCELVTVEHPRVSDESIGGPVFEKGETRHVDLNDIIFTRWTNSEETDVDYGMVANLTGVRTAESLTRLRGVLQGGWIAEKSSNMHYLKPIYDWRDHDLWRAHDIKDWPYNHAYDKLAKAGVPRSQWRTAQPYGPEPLRGLDDFKKAWPDLWDRAMHRVPGATAADMWQFELYQANKRDGETWQDAAIRYFRNVRDEEKRDEIRKKMNSVLEGHQSHSTQPLPQSRKCPYCEWSWKRIASNNSRGIRKWRKGDA